MQHQLVDWIVLNQFLILLSVSQSDGTVDDFQMPVRGPPIGVNRKAFGVPCHDISGFKKMMLVHPSKPDNRLVYCSDVLDDFRSLGFTEKIENGVLDSETMFFSYMHPCPRGHAPDSGLCPTPKLPRDNIDGLHPFTYKAFLDALNHYLQKESTQEIYVMRFVPVDLADDPNLVINIADWRVWYVAELKGESFVYANNHLDMEDYVRYIDMFEYDH